MKKGSLVDLNPGGDIDADLCIFLSKLINFGIIDEAVFDQMACQSSVI